MSKEKKLKVAVLFGGIGPERQISLQSGENLCKAVADAGMEPVPFDITPDNTSILDDDSIDIFFPILHGQFGEDGTVQQLLEQKGCCFVGSGSNASKLAFDKLKCKEYLKPLGIPLPPHIHINPGDKPQDILQKLTAFVKETTAKKFVVKPTSCGSSVGISIVDSITDAANIAAETANEFGTTLIESFIPGREITITILDNQTLPIIEIRSKHSFYDYHAKYIDDSTEFLFDTITKQQVIDHINLLALKTFNALSCRHWGRVDMILTDDDQPYFLEINTLPGFTSHSLVPLAAKKAGISPAQFVARVISAALTEQTRC